MYYLAIEKTVIKEYKNKLNTAFRSLPEEIREHSRRIQYYSEELLKKCIELGYYSENPLTANKKAVSVFKNVVKFHDIGKAKVSMDAYEGYEGLSAEKWAEYKKHVIEGIKYFDSLIDLSKVDGEDLFFFTTARQCIAEHHENFDGTGYPYELFANNISLAGKICSLANMIDYLTFGSEQRDRLSFESAAEEINKLSGTYFDPNLVDVLNACIPIFTEAQHEGAINKISAGRKSLPAMQLLFRPVYDYNNRQTYGYQIITRLNDKVMGELMPELYVPVAEKSNKINEITKWTVEELCEARNRLELKDRYLGTMFIDLSVKCLTKRYFIENLVKITAKYNVPNDEICFIIPEGMLSLDIEKIIPAVSKLKANGFLVAIGGFGSEYSNLVSLGEIEFDYLMLGEDFVKNIDTSNRARKVCESVVEMSNKLDTLVICDGITSKDSANALFSMGCALMRGKHFGVFVEERYI